MALHLSRHASVLQPQQTTRQPTKHCDSCTKPALHLSPVSPNYFPSNGNSGNTQLSWQSVRKLSCFKLCMIGVGQRSLRQLSQELKAEHMHGLQNLHGILSSAGFIRICDTHHLKSVLHWPCGIIAATHVAGAGTDIPLKLRLSAPRQPGAAVNTCRLALQEQPEQQLEALFLCTLHGKQLMPLQSKYYPQPTSNQ